MKPRPKSDRRPVTAGFTLIELMLAAVAAAMILVIINGIFVRAIHLRDDATERVRTTRLRARAERALRDDLQSALVSGGILASTLTGGTNSTGGPGGAGFPGYLKLTATNGRSAGGTVASDVQQVEYYVTKDPNAGPNTPNSGVLVRATTRDLLASVPVVAREETLLAGVQSLQVQFYDGTNWLDTWEFDSDTANASASTGGTTITTGNTTLPEAIRVDVRLYAKPGDLPAPPVEVLVPWVTQPFVGATPAPATAASGDSASPSPSPSATPREPERPPGDDGGPPGGGPPGGEPPGGGPPPGEPPTSGPGRPPRR